MKISTALFELKQASHETLRKKLNFVERMMDQEHVKS